MKHRYTSFVLFSLSVMFTFTAAIGQEKEAFFQDGTKLYYTMFDTTV